MSARPTAPKALGSFPEGEQKAHEYTYLARSAMCAQNYYMYALVNVKKCAFLNVDDFARFLFSSFTLIPSGR